MSAGKGIPTASPPTGYQHKDKDHSTTHSAVEEGVIIIRDKDKQQQDINTLSRDTQNANNELAPIFDKQKELDRIEKIELVADIASQAKDLAQKYSRMQAEEKYKALSPEEKDDINNKIRKELEGRGVDFSEYNEEGKQAVIRDEYIRQVSQREGIGNMGDGFSKGIDAATSIVIGIIKGDITGGLAGASAPYLATLIKENTYVLDEYGNKKLDKNGDYIVNKPANLAAHAILGAVVAELQGNSGLSGGMGALTGEFAATYIREYLYGKKVEDLTEAEKRNISSLAQLASGLAVASVGGNTGDIAAAIASSKNAVENNDLGDNPYEELYNAGLGLFDGDKRKAKSFADENNADIVKVTLPIIAAEIAAPFAVAYAGPAVYACLSNPLLCLNNVGMFTVEVVGGEATSMGLMAGAGSLATKLTAEEVKILVDVMKKDLAFAKKLEEAVVNQITTTQLSKNIIYDIEKNIITILDKNAGQTNNVIKGFNQTETKIINEAQGILDSKAMSQIHQAHATGQPVTVVVNGRTIQYEPNLPASGMTMFGENGFLIGKEAFKSQAELQKTILHELHRLNTSSAAGGVSGSLAAQETKAAFDFAEKASSVLGNK